ncbi:MAG: NUDIX hydrolase [Chloroflexi bacterium]|nr:NUDIX hydrolase [Chloroflexota bacterium]
MAETILSSERRYEGRILSLRLDTVRLSNGQAMVREVIEHNAAVAIVPVDAAGDVYLVRQHRVGSNGPLVEIPAGMVEDGEDPAECAARELQEEIGYAAEQLELLGVFYLAPGYSTELMYLYLARDLRESKLEQDFDEAIEVEKMPLSAAIGRLAAGGEPTDMKTIAGLLLARGRLGVRG